MKIILRICSLIGVIVSIAWIYFDFGFTSISTLIAISCVFVATFIGTKNKNAKSNFTIKAGDNSNNYQSKGDMTINKN